METVTVIERQYGPRILKGDFHIFQDKVGDRVEVNMVKSYSLLSLYDLGYLKYPLIWGGVKLGVDAGHAALRIFEETGVTLHYSPFDLMVGGAN